MPGASPQLFVWPCPRHGRMDRPATATLIDKILGHKKAQLRSDAGTTADHDPRTRGARTRRVGSERRRDRARAGHPARHAEEPHRAPAHHVGHARPATARDHRPRSGCVPDRPILLRNPPRGSNLIPEPQPQRTPLHNPRARPPQPHP